MKPLIYLVLSVASFSALPAHLVAGNSNAALGDPVIVSIGDLLSLRISPKEDDNADVMIEVQATNLSNKNAYIISGDAPWSHGPDFRAYFSTEDVNISNNSELWMRLIVGDSFNFKAEVFQPGKSEMRRIPIGVWYPGLASKSVRRATNIYVNWNFRLKVFDRDPFEVPRGEKVKPIVSTRVGGFFIVPKLEDGPVRTQ